MIAMLPQIDVPDLSQTETAAESLRTRQSAGGDSDDSSSTAFAGGDSDDASSTAFNSDSDSVSATQ